MMKQALWSALGGRASSAGFLSLLLGLAALAADRPLACLQANPNLIQNPGFENTSPGHLMSTTRPWVGEEPNIVTVVKDGHAHSGTQEALITSDGINSGQLMQMISVLPNTVYQASAWIGGTPGYAQAGGFLIAIPLDDHDGDGDTGFDAGSLLQAVDVAVDASGSYKFYTFSFNSGSHNQLFLKVGMDAGKKAGTIVRVDDVSVTAATTTGGGGGGALPSPWVDQDVGGVGVQGSASFAGGVFTVKGAGADIGGTADSFNYVYQHLTGDGSLVAHVTSLGNTAPGAQAGVMIRETLDPASPFVDMLITPGRGASFQGRIQSGSSNFNDGGPQVVAPYWLKISRTGNTFIGSTSSTGQTWTVAGTATVPMGQTVFIGLAVVSQNTGALDTAVFDSVTR